MTDALPSLKRVNVYLLAVASLIVALTHTSTELLAERESFDNWFAQRHRRQAFLSLAKPVPKLARGLREPSMVTIEETQRSNGSRFLPGITGIAIQKRFNEKNCRISSMICTTSFDAIALGTTLSIGGFSLWMKNR